MVDQQLTVEITGQELRAGDDRSRVSISVKNGTNSDGSWTFYLTLPRSLVQADNVTDIRFSPIAHIAHPAQGTPHRNDGTTWLIGDTRGTDIAVGAEARFALSNVKPAQAGSHQIGIEWYDASHSDLVGSCALNVTVLPKEAIPNIKFFTAQPEIVLRQKGSRIELSWEAEADVVELRRCGGDTLLPAPDSAEISAPLKCSSWPDPDTGNYSTGIQSYLLAATSAGRTVTRQLLVRIQEPGWNEIADCHLGSPTLLLNDGDDALYGVFLTGESAALYKVDTSQLMLGNDSTGSNKGAVPKGLEKSPGAFWQNRIWLVGGSQIDPDVCSNRVWWLDPTTGISGDSRATWSPRMGHACVLFNNRLWVLGGVDENGNPLKQVWSTKDGHSWNQHPPPAIWTGSCLLSAAAVETGRFQSRLYVYGGVDEPFGTPQTGLFYSTDGDQWKAQELRGTGAKGNDLGYGLPYGSALCVTHGLSSTSPSLIILGTYKKTDEYTFYYRATQLDAEALRPLPGNLETHPWRTKGDDDMQQPFRLSAVGFRGFIFVVPVLYDANPHSITYYVPH